MVDWVRDGTFLLTKSAIADKEKNVGENDPYYSFYHQWKHVTGCYWFTTEPLYEKDGFPHPILYIGESGESPSRTSGLLYRACCAFTNYGESKKSSIIMPLVAKGVNIEIHVEKNIASDVKSREGHLIRKYALEISYPFFKKMGDHCRPPLNDIWETGCGCEICQECDRLLGRI